MSARHHPSDETLAAFAAGTLDAARRLVVATHLELCGECRRGMIALEAAAGAMIDDLEPNPLRPGALGRALAKLDTVPVEPRPAGARFGRALEAHGLGPWRWMGRGVAFRRVDVDAGKDVRVFILRAAPGTRLPPHRHEGAEWTCVLRGAFRHDLGVYGAADFDEADETVEHHPFVEQGEECICLVALQGRIALQGWVGRVLQPLIRF